MYYFTVTVHVLSAIVWLGGMLFFALVAPLLRAVPDETIRIGLFDALGRRFRTVGWVCIGLLIVTGVGQLHLRGWWGAGFWGAPGFWSTSLGRAFTAKLLTVGFMLAVQAVHDFWLGPRAGKAAPGSAAASVLRRRAAWLARINSIVGLLLIYFAVRLARGG
jgi:copper resistance protein D